MTILRVIPIIACALPLLTACVGMPDGQESQQAPVKPSRFVGSRLPSDTAPANVVNARPEAIERARKNSLIGPP